MAVKIFSYNPGSRGARGLAAALGARVLRRDSTWRGRNGDTVINWGASNVTGAGLQVDVQLLNRPEYVRRAGNKLEFFSLEREPRHNTDLFPRFPEWTTDPQVAHRWDSTIVCRTVLTGHSGRGIIIVERGENIPNAPLYTRYVKKSAEFRVHIVKGAIIDVQRKIRDPDREPTDWRVRSHDNGFIYVRTGFVVPADVREQAGRAFVVSQLDFGAVDVLWNEAQGQAYVLEINTAPGLEGTTIEKYAEAFRRLI